MKKLSVKTLTVVLLSILTFSSANQRPTLMAMTREMKRSFNHLRRAKPVPLYFLQYEVWDEYQVYITASQGAVFFEKDERHRYLDVDVRVGSPSLDNTHEIRGSYDYLAWIPSIIEVPIDADPDALRSVLWAETDRRFKEAQEKYIKILTERQVKVAETDTSADFSSSQAVKYLDEPKEITLILKPWSEKLNCFSRVFKKYPWIYDSQVSLQITALTKYLVNTDGSQICESSMRYRIRLFAATIADDGMELYLGHTFYAGIPEKIPTDEEITTGIDSLIENLDALRNAPIVEPYSGPAILVNQASGVFFHEIFGHRIEGHRQKSEYEGQTFTKKLGERIMPDFIFIYDDPTLSSFNGKYLNGHYRFDDEGVAAQRAVVVENGVLKGFLMSRSPIEGFSVSNGHGRRQYGRRVVARQGVLFIKSEKETPFDKLREALIAECEKQDKPYGLIFYDIAGGFTQTGRTGTQTFKVIPLFVKRVYVDGRPDEVVRGVDIVGTPLLSISKILLTGDDYEIFNGACGAESGMVPVSSISPSILVSEIEVEKKAKSQDKPPILPAPADESKKRR